MTKIIPNYGVKKNSSGKLYGYVYINGKHISLGPDGPKAREIYNRIVTEFLSNKLPVPNGATITINELFGRFLTHAKVYYRKPSGRQTTEYNNYKYTMKVVIPIYGNLPVDDFGPLKLKNCREQMIEKGWCRNYINQSIRRITHIYKWGTEEELVSPDKWLALKSVKGLAKGRTRAKENPKVTDIPLDSIFAVEPFVSLQIWGAITICLYSGCRPGEALNMRMCDIDKSGEIWIYAPAEHKTEHHDKDRRIFLGPECQQLILKFMNRPADSYLFDPRDAVKERNSQGKAKRRKNQKSNLRKTKRVIREKYDTSSFHQAVSRACDKAGIPRWSPNQLRHTNATIIRKNFGIDDACTFLGHSHISTTEIYAEKHLEKGKNIAQNIGKVI